jgi:hypothetical protein
MASLGRNVRENNFLGNLIKRAADSFWNSHFQICFERLNHPDLTKLQSLRGNA